MKLDQLRKIIREEVSAAVKEELQDVITEAVKIASTPEPKLQKANAYVKVSESMPKKWSTPIGKQGSLETMLEQTAVSMTSQDARNFVGGGVHKPNLASRAVTELANTGGAEVGVSFSDIPGFDPKKATAILKAAEEKSKQRTGV